MQPAQPAKAAVPATTALTEAELAARREEELLILTSESTPDGRRAYFA